MKADKRTAQQDAHSPLRLREYLTAFSQARVLILGDIMLDEYLTGDAERISPEAPVPVVRVERESLFVGGSGNVARNVTALGGEAILVGARGKDAPGLSLERALRRDNIPFSLLTMPQRPTTIKTRVLARRQQVLRIDKEDDTPFSSQESEQLLALVEKSLPRCNAVVLSDYGKGLVTAQTVNGLHRLIAASGRSIPLLVDPKPRNFSLYAGVTLLTPNTKETGESVNMPVKQPEEIILAGREIMRRLNCNHLVTTLGSQGMAVFEDEHSVLHIPTTARQVFDVTGAGDTVIATLALGAALGLPLVAACLLANYAAGIVVGSVGAATATPGQVAEALSTLPRPLISSWSQGAAPA